jgi:radical SAM protein with 4Fe4S-binding SPASM domain
MKAKKVDSWRNMDRVILREAVPLPQPILMDLEVSSACNLKCNFCHHSLSSTELAELSFSPGIMTTETCGKIIEQLKDFPNPLKEISVGVRGEPLLNRNFAAMMSQLKQHGIVKTLRVFTNGLALTNEVAAEIADCGIDALHISINGLDSDDYKRHTAVELDFNTLVSQIAYMYAHKGSGMTINIKTLSSVLENRPEQMFFDIFGNYCDNISVHNTVDMVSKVKYDKLQNVTNAGELYKNANSREIEVCAQPFFRFTMFYDGTVGFCQQTGGPTYGNINDTKLSDLWNGSKHKEFMLKNLRRDYSGQNEMCRDCKAKALIATDADYLDPYAEEIISRIQNL